MSQGVSLKLHPGRRVCFPLVATTQQGRLASSRWLMPCVAPSALVSRWCWRHRKAAEAKAFENPVRRSGGSVLGWNYPLPGCNRGKWRFRLGIPEPKYAIILVVTRILGGGHTQILWRVPRSCWGSIRWEFSIMMFHVNVPWIFVLGGGWLMFHPCSIH